MTATQPKDLAEYVINHRDKEECTCTLLVPHTRSAHTRYISVCAVFLSYFHLLKISVLTLVHVK